MGAKNSNGKKKSKKGVSLVNLKKYLKVEVLDFLGEKRNSLKTFQSSNLILIHNQFYEIVCQKMDVSLTLNITYADENFETNFTKGSENIMSFKTFRLHYFEYPGNEMFGLTYIGKTIRKLKNKIESFELKIHGYSIREEYFNDFSKNLMSLTHLKSFKLDMTETVISSQCLKIMLTKLKHFEHLNVFHFSMNTKKIPFNCNISEGLKQIPKVKELKLDLREKDISLEFSDISLIINGKKTLTYLYIDITKNLVHDANIISFCKSLEELKLLQELHLLIGYNKLRKPGLENLISSLQHFDLMRTLEINFGETDIHEDNILLLATSLKSMKFLYSLTLRFSFEKEENLIPLLLQLSDLKFLTILKMNINNTFKNIPFSMKSFTKTVRKLKNLEVLNLDFEEIMIGEEPLATFIQSLSNLKKLLYLNLNVLSPMKDDGYKKLVSPLISMESIISQKITINNKIIGL